MARVSESWRSLAGICVPDTPCVMVRIIAASVDPCTQRPEVRSGPFPPPLAFKPWQGAQFVRKRDPPSLILTKLSAGGLCVVTRLACAALPREYAPASTAAKNAVPIKYCLHCLCPERGNIPPQAPLPEGLLDLFCSSIRPITVLYAP